jgi:hydrogenase expression/formation protein HypE
MSENIPAGATRLADLPEVLAKIERARQARRSKFALRETQITLSHGSGGKASHNLIEGVFGPAFANPLLDRMDDAAVLDFGFWLSDATTPTARVAFTTDSYVVSPLFFPGGDIGRLAVHGTINDLATAGARPLYLSAGFILEEGFPVADLRRIVASMASAAAEAGVAIVAGDTKVVQRGKADGVFINTAGVGLVEASWPLGQAHARPGDKVLLSGPVGDHGIAIMLAREGLEIESAIVSDSAPLHGLAAALLAAAGPGLHCMKDPTRGGVATTLNEVALASEAAIALEEGAIPVRAEVRGACELLGLDPLTIANEGKLLAIVAPEAAEAALAAMRAHPLGREAALIGEVRAEPAGMLFLRTEIGGTRVLDMLVGDPLPRIC